MALSSSKTIILYDPAIDPSRQPHELHNSLVSARAIYKQNYIFMFLTTAMHHNFEYSYFICPRTLGKSKIVVFVKINTSSFYFQANFILRDYPFIIEIFFAIFSNDLSLNMAGLLAAVQGRILLQLSHLTKRDHKYNSLPSPQKRCIVLSWRLRSQC